MRVAALVWLLVELCLVGCGRRPAEAPPVTPPPRAVSEEPRAWQFTGPGTNLKDVPVALTVDDERAQRVAYRRASLVESYRRHGDHAADWDAEVTELLEACAELAGQWPPPNTEQLLARCRAVEQAGCQDAHLLRVTAELAGGDVAPGWHAERGAKLVALAGERPMTPNARPIEALGKLIAREAASAAPKAAKLRARLVEWITAAAAEPLTSEGWQRSLYGRVTAAEPVFDHDTAQALIDRLADEPVDPWLRSVLTGWAKRRLAWLARGGGYADTVTEAGAREFERWMRDAYPDLVAAHHLHPEWPEAASELIDVAMAGYAPAADTARQWFDQAVAAQIDYRGAYDRYLWSLLPRWGGSHEAILEVVRECIYADHYATDVPLYVLSGLKLIWELDEDQTVWDTPHLWQDLSHFSDQWAASLGERPGATAVQGMKAAFAAKTGRDAEAWELLGGVSDEELWLAVDAVGGSALRLREGLYAKFGAAREEIALARARETSDRRAAIEAYEAALAKDPDYYDAEAVKAKIASYRRRQEQETSADWVEVSLDDPNGPDWTAACEFRTTDDGAIYAPTDPVAANPAWIAPEPGFAFRGEFETELRVRFGDPSGAPTVLVWIHDRSTSPRFVQFELRPAEGVAVAKSADAEVGRREFTVTPVCQLRLRCRQRQATLTLNDEELFRLEVPPRAGGISALPPFGFGVEFGAKPAVVKFDQLRVRQLKE